MDLYISTHILYMYAYQHIHLDIGSIFQDSYESHSIYDPDVTEGLFSEDSEKVDFSLMVYIANLEKNRKSYSPLLDSLVLIFFSGKSSNGVLGYDEFQRLIFFD